MSAVTRAVLVGSTYALALSAVGSWASKVGGFEYALLAPLSFAVYAAVGAYVGRRTVSPPRPVIAGGAVALVDSTIGWMIATAIAPDPTASVHTDEYIAAIMGVTLLGAVAAGLGAAAARRRRAAAAAPPR
jgi:hypothetical protein